MNKTDLCVVGASYAGLACASAAADANLKVHVLEAKPEVGHRPHTTGILVQEAVEHLPEIPVSLIRPVRGVRLYSPSLRSFDLKSEGYAFLSADTPGLLRWMSDDLCKHQNVTLQTRAKFKQAEEREGGLYMPDHDLFARYLIGADGARSSVASHFGFGKNNQFLIGMELEFAGHDHMDDRFLHVFVDSKLAPGYIAWVVPGVGITQVGLACKHPAHLAIEQLIEKLKSIFDFSTLKPIERRGGLIPVGGVVNPIANDHAMIVGDAAGMVSPLTAGGIHKALELGKLAGQSIALNLNGGNARPENALLKASPRYRFKRQLRRIANIGVPNPIMEMIFGNFLFRRFTQLVVFHHRGLLSKDGWDAAFGKID
ncbi:NAD(P)/FAD-dependent oxidoreductase [Candidatus Albibeggiatoa sp. nov. NOAA]|uniref:NAD(P)/FAD-dependent oxidoreductase n=1 Tax=Candidatus Albibeggiatoa sp. nov. NOAA TaxID=3162724 RepID=UPI0032F55CD9|nr:NAD(P)/FAD-dependent oxidoreductase [Thiotrichaceae bacterium]